MNTPRDTDGHHGVFDRVFKPNKQNVVLATINALGQLKAPEEVARLRGKSVEEILD